MYTSSKPYFYGTGRRKKSVARVRIVPGTGAITINKKDIDEYFGLETLKLIVNQPFGVTGTAGKFDIIANVNGGGLSGQAGAIRHGLARALVQADEANKPALKAAGFNAKGYVSPGTGHEFLTWRRSLREMAPMLFQK